MGRMPTLPTNGVERNHEEHGSGAPIVCIHGAGSTALAWAHAIQKLSRLGRVIAYDRRGCSRSERPEPHERTSVAEHADDAAAMIDALGAAPAVVIGRSYGATVATDLALRHPDRVRALVLLEGDAPRDMAPAVAEWADAPTERLVEVGARSGVDAVAEALITAVAGEDAWPVLPAEVRRLLEGNRQASAPEVQGEWWLDADASALATIDQPVLLVAAADSPPALRQPVEPLEGARPNARTALVAGGHLIDPAAPEVLSFVREILERGPR